MAQKYIWNDEHWPNMYWDYDALSKMLSNVNELRGNLAGVMSVFGLKERDDSMISSLTQEILHSAEIEGERLNHDRVRSSLARQLGLDYAGLPTPDHYTEGVVQVLLDATQNYKTDISAERLFGWHAALFPTGYSGMYRITVGNWRKGPDAMQVVSGALGKQKVHFEAPASDMVDGMMNSFLQWLNTTDDNIDPIVKAAVAHLWFVTIHPFDDGNGRICRTITEWQLSRADNAPQRFYSLSSEILNNRNDYYNHLEKAQKGSLDVTEWIAWFISILEKALLTAIGKTERVRFKTLFWNKHNATPLNDRQRKVINMLLDGFDGKLNSSKWYKINHCSQDTASRDINDLIEKDILRKVAGSGGRSTCYELCP